MKNSDIRLDLFRRIDTLSDDLLQELQLVVENFITKKEIPTILKERKFGTMKGLITYMADDFDEPLEDFKDYM
jgi:hypothetical protein